MLVQGPWMFCRAVRSSLGWWLFGYIVIISKYDASFDKTTFSTKTYTPSSSFQKRPFQETQYILLNWSHTWLLNPRAQANGSLQPDTSPTILASGIGCTDKRGIPPASASFLRSHAILDPSRSSSVSQSKSKTKTHIYIYIYKYIYVYIYIYICI